MSNVAFTGEAAVPLHGRTSVPAPVGQLRPLSNKAITDMSLAPVRRLRPLSKKAINYGRSRTRQPGKLPSIERDRQSM